MPKAMHEVLKKSAQKKFGTTRSPRAKRYIYGTMAKRERKGNSTLSRLGT